MRLLNGSPRISPRLAKASLAFALVVLAASFLGAAAFSLGVTQKEQSGRVAEGAPAGDQPEKTGSISGTVYDPSGAVIPGADVTLTNMETQGTIVGQTREDGAFEFPALPAGRYQLEITNPGFARAKSAELELNRSSNLHQNMTLRLGETTQHILINAHKGAENPPAPAPPHPPRRIRVGGLVYSAKLLSAPKPVYPASAQKRGIEGTVILQAVIGTSGQILSLSPKSGPDPALIKAAMDAVRQWLYFPTLLNGVPVEVATTIEVEFHLDE